MPPPAGTVPIAGDCDDTDAAISPDGREICGGADDDCDGRIDDADDDLDPDTTRAFFRDADGDGAGDADAMVRSCARPSGYVERSDDCDDSARDVRPGAREVCDGEDNDCDRLTDDADPDLDTTGTATFYADSDRDGYGAGAAVVACVRPGAHAARAGDCDDAEADVHPAAREICDGLDNDCDGTADRIGAAASQCASFAGSYAGTYAIVAEERLGSSVINRMACTGTSTITVDLAELPAVSGTMACTRAGGLLRFDSRQTATLEGEVDPAGVLHGRLTHRYASDLVRTYTVEGPISGGGLSVTGEGSLSPSSFSAVPWVVDVVIESP